MEGSILLTGYETDVVFSWNALNKDWNQRKLLIQLIGIDNNLKIKTKNKKKIFLYDPCQIFIAPML